MLATVARGGREEDDEGTRAHGCLQGLTAKAGGARALARRERLARLRVDAHVGKDVDGQCLEPRSLRARGRCARRARPTGSVRRARRTTVRSVRARVAGDLRGRGARMRGNGSQQHRS